VKGRVLGILFLSMFVALPGWADTKKGSANPSSIQLWEVTPVGDGQLLITLSWSNTNADVAMLVVCGAEPFILPWGAALGGLNRMAALNVGVVSDVPCLVGVSALRGSSGYRLHFQHAVSEVSRPRGRERLATASTTVAAGSEDSPLAAAVEREMAKLKRLAVLR